LDVIPLKTRVVLPSGNMGTVCYADPRILCDPLGPEDVTVIADNTTYMQAFSRDSLQVQGTDPAVCDPHKCGHSNANACIYGGIGPN
jgi:hypothetical protein